MFAIMSRVRIENDPKKKQHEKTLIEISIPDRLTAEAYLQRSLRKTETLRGQGWAKVTGNKLELKQTPKIVGENIIEIAKQWEEKIKKDYGENRTKFIHRIAKVVCENQFREDSKKYTTHLLNSHGVDIEKIQYYTAEPLEQLQAITISIPISKQKTEENKEKSQSNYGIKEW